MLTTLEIRSAGSGAVWVICRERVEEEEFRRWLWPVGGGDSVVDEDSGSCEVEDG